MLKVDLSQIHQLTLLVTTELLTVKSLAVK